MPNMLFTKSAGDFQSTLCNVEQREHEAFSFSATLTFVVIFLSDFTAVTKHNAVHMQPVSQHACYKRHVRAFLGELLPQRARSPADTYSTIKCCVHATACAANNMTRFAAHPLLQNSLHALKARHTCMSLPEALAKVLLEVPVPATDFSQGCE
jgi:hypothetical protein